MQGMKVLTLGAAFAAAGGSAALADPRLDEKVYAPYVERGVAELEWRRAEEVGGRQAGVRTDVVEIEYGLTDAISLAIVGDLESAPGVAGALNGIGVEGVVYLGQIPRLGVDIGAYLEYKAGRNGEDDAGELKLLLAKASDRFQGLVNLIVERPFGVPDGEGYASYGYAGSATWRTVSTLRIGVEAFGDLGTDHDFLASAKGAYLGPQLKWEGRLVSSPFDVGIDAGWLAALGPDRREARSQVRMNLEVERRF
jgi:hypothetical protein